METSQTTTMAKAKTKKYSRSRPLPPDVTSRNLAIEKRRREDMNRIFLDLASCVPPLASVKRPSKRLIVVESVQHLRQQRDMCIAAARELRELLSTHNDLIAEVNTLRSQLGVPAKNAPRSPSTAFFSLMDIENQAYGEFPDGFASPSTTENNESQPSGTQREVYTSLPGASMTPDLVSPVQTSAQDFPIHYVDGTLDAVPPEDWLAQTSGHLFSSSNEQGATALSTDWWALDVAGLNSEFPWEDLPAHILPLPLGEAPNNVTRGHA